ncbi:5' nucleotidase, NT5C type [Corynebacterium pilosum]|uniref:Uncharacterized protein conserved in bacteria n=1 Tax=Corynebacterium pilosum TaxID=35756 RepID=A0A376CNW1_9CORY|nr:hypothetical protein [Corynebacterium pilosum]STC69789.1 Uncharacterized protein conserved in bacteria [Corynebacterium pilosum]
MQKKINGRAIVGVDLDGVVADYTAAIRPYVAQHKGVSPDDLPDPTTYNLVKAGWGIENGAEYLQIHRAAVKDGLYVNMPAIDGAAEAMRKLSDAGAHIRVVTHRLIMGGSHRRVVTDTAEWLDAHDIPYMSLCFTGLKDSVAAHVYLEDSPTNIEALRKEGYTTIVYDQLYNREVPGPRISKWPDGAEAVLDELRSQDQLDW